jgi:hypothetical protein
MNDPVSVSSASQIAVSSMRFCVVPSAPPEISRTVPARSINAAQPPRPCIPFALQLPSVHTTVFTPTRSSPAVPEAILSSCIGLVCQKGKPQPTEALGAFKRIAPG